MLCFLFNAFYDYFFFLFIFLSRRIFRRIFFFSFLLFFSLFFILFEVSFPPQHTLHSGMDFNIMLFFLCSLHTHPKLVPNCRLTHSKWFPFFCFFFFSLGDLLCVCVYCDIVCVLYLCSDVEKKHFPNIPLLFCPIVCAPAADSTTHKYTHTDKERETNFPMYIENEIFPAVVVGCVVGVECMCSQQISKRMCVIISFNCVF